MRGRRRNLHLVLVLNVEGIKSSQECLLLGQPEPVVHANSASMLLHRLAPPAIQRRLDGTQAHALVVALGEQPELCRQSNVRIDRELRTDL